MQSYSDDLPNFERTADELHAQLRKEVRVLARYIRRENNLLQNERFRESANRACDIIDAIDKNSELHAESLIKIRNDTAKILKWIQWVVLPICTLGVCVAVYSLLQITNFLGFAT